jgi:uncharacterized protein (DUF2147 family)
MKKRLVQFFAVAIMISVVACNNDNTEKAAETKTAKPATETPVKVEPKTEISIGPDGAAVETKKVNVKVNTKDTL